MQGAEHRPVSQLCTEFRDGAEHFLFGNLPEDVLSEVRSNRLHFRGDGRVVRSQIRVGSLGVGDAEAVAGPVQVEVDPFDPWLLRILEVHVAQASYGTGHLIHQTAGLSEVDVLRVLSDLCDGYVIAGHFIVKPVQDRSDQSLERSGRGETGTTQDLTRDIGFEAADLVSPCCKSGSHTPDQTGSGAFLFRKR